MASKYECRKCGEHFQAEKAAGCAGCGSSEGLKCPRCNSVDVKQIPAGSEKAFGIPLFRPRHFG